MDCWQRPEPPFSLLLNIQRSKELTGATNLVKHFGLSGLQEELTESKVATFVEDSGYLRRVVGSTEIRRGPGMELGPLLKSGDATQSSAEKIFPLNLDRLRAAFTLRESRETSLPQCERGEATAGRRDDEGGREVEGGREREGGKKGRKEKASRGGMEGKGAKVEEGKERETGKENGEHRSRKHKKKKRGGEGEEEKKHKKKQVAEAKMTRGSTDTEALTCLFLYHNWCRNSVCPK